MAALQATGIEGTGDKELSPIHKRALGAILGACGGDAMGAVLEKLPRKPTETEVSMAASMCGGGALRVAPGQVTDDGEMTMSLLWAECVEQWDIEKIASWYAKWAQSSPFDMGVTIGASIGCVLKGANNSAFKAHLKKIGYANAMTNAAKFDGNTSQSNGSLMRSSPIGVYCHRIEDDNMIAQAASQDSMLSHQNKNVCDAVSCYSIAIAELVHSGDKSRAFSRVKQWATEHASDEVKQWLTDAENNVQVPYHPNAGWARIGFTHAFRFLILGTSYMDALRESLLAGGDTDTNACIIGGLLGAYHGIDGIPSFIVKALTLCDTSQGRPRPKFLHTSNIFELVPRVLQNAPATITTSTTQTTKQQSKETENTITQK